MKKRTKKILICFILWAALLLLVPGCLLFYAFQVEPYRLTVNRVFPDEAKVGDAGPTVAQISDLHIKEDFTHKNLKKVVDQLNALAPDIVVFTGDLYDNYARYRDDENITAELKRIEAPYAKIAVWGNRDYGGGAVRRYEAILADSDFILLKNQNLPIVLGDGRTVLFTGLDDSLLGKPMLPDTGGFQANYRILLTHEPDVADQYRSHSFDLVVAGHSHGGQVKIPFLDGITTSLGEKYVRGLYNFDSGGIRKLYVNTGIGTTRISARFNVIPEITLFCL